MRLGHYFAQQVCILILLWRGKYYFVATALSLESRRNVIATVLAHSGGVGAFVWTTAPSRSNGAEPDSVVAKGSGGEVVEFYNYATRDRRGNREAVIRDDYWFISGKLPPRLLGGPLVEMGNPQFNAFGSCETTANGQNSCTYVSLKQRIPAYTKYASSISYGAGQYQQLGQVLTKLWHTRSIPPPQSANRDDDDDNKEWSEAASYLERQDKVFPPGIIDAELKMLLLATAMLTSPNFPGPSKELLVSRYYINELHFANAEMLQAIQTRNAARAMNAWSYGKDSWNSYYQTIDRQIVPKVGEKFVPIVVL